jgi:putative transposase
MGVDEVREYRELKRENARLKKLLADRELEIDAMKEVMRKKF